MNPGVPLGQGEPQRDRVAAPPAHGAGARPAKQTDSPPLASTRHASPAWPGVVTGSSGFLGFSGQIRGRCGFRAARDEAPARGARGIGSTRSKLLVHVGKWRQMVTSWCFQQLTLVCWFAGRREASHRAGRRARSHGASCCGAGGDGSGRGIARPGPAGRTGGLVAMPQVGVPQEDSHDRSQSRREVGTESCRRLAVRRRPVPGEDAVCQTTARPPRGAAPGNRPRRPQFRLATRRRSAFTYSQICSCSEGSLPLRSFSTACCGTIRRYPSRSRSAEGYSPR